MFAPDLQFAYCEICGQNAANPISASVLSPVPMMPSTLAARAKRGRAVPAFRDRDIAVNDSQRPTAPMTMVTARTTIPRRRLALTPGHPSRLMIASISAANARCCSTAPAGLRGCEGSGLT